MTLLILSDSHGTLGYMRRCVAEICPDVLVHLGDVVEDAQKLHGEFPDVPMYQVPGNCDYFYPPELDTVRIVTLEGVKLFLTHGHKHRVKEGSARLLQDARANAVHAVLYGHTHQEVCRQEEDGLWVVNPGSCGGILTRTAAVMELGDGKIHSCRLLKDESHSFLKL